VVLLNEQTVTVEENGRVTTTSRGAIKVLTREGRKDARGIVSYDTRSEKVRDFRAWIVRPSGETKKYGKDSILDIALAPNDVYNEVRARAVSGEGDSDPGAVFGYETVTERQSIFTQFEYRFQDYLPVLMSRFALTLPAGWRPNVVVFNGNIKMQTSGSTYTWERRALPFIEEEPSSPSIAALALRLEVSYVPSENARPMMGRMFTGWSDVARSASLCRKCITCLFRPASGGAVGTSRIRPRTFSRSSTAIAKIKRTSCAPCSRWRAFHRIR
jgi:Domain of Unknown Function with PDB structure (DUF3857)